MTLGLSLRTLKNQAKITVGNGRFRSSIHQIKHPLHSHGSLDHESFTLFSKLSRSRYAHQLFDEIPLKDISHYNRLLFDFSRNDHNREALHLFKDLHSSGLAVDGSTLSCALKVCGVLFDQVVGRQVHCQSLKSGFLEDVSVGTALVDMYMKTEDFEDGRGVFDEMGIKNVVSWTSLMAGYARNGLNDEAIHLINQMQMEGVKPNDFTFATVLGSLADESRIEGGAQVHAMIVKNGFELTTSVCNSLTCMYLKSEMVGDAEAVFDSMLVRDPVTWNIMIAGYAAIGFDLEGFEMFHRMRLAGVKLSHTVICTVLKLCSHQRELSFIKQLHCGVVKNGYEFDHNVRTALLVTYSKCSSVDEAFKLFSMVDGAHNVVTWTAMIGGFVQNNNNEKAVDLFRRMNREGIRPNHFTYSTVLAGKPSSLLGQLHAQIIKADYEKVPSVATALLDAYIKTGNVVESAQVFYSIDAKDIVAWSAMLSGLAQTGDFEKAMEVFIQLVKEGVKPNEYTFSSVINACSSPAATVEHGKQIHATAVKSGKSNALCVSSSLLTMYSKRGNIESANKVFSRQEEKDIVSWNSMITGYAQHGDAKKALEVFQVMRNQGLPMDDVTFIGVLTACTHAGLVEEGEKYFNIMINDCHIDQTIEHYSCMVDLYSRAGMFDKAMGIMNEMPFPASPTMWRTLLAACRVHRNLEFGKLAAEKLISLQPNDSAAYVLLSNIHAVAGNWQERAQVRKLMDDRKVKKEAGCSWIEVKNRIFSFLAGDVSHPFSDVLYAKLEELSIKLKDMGYQPDTNYVLHDVEEEHKEAILSQHSERLAIAYGLIALPPGAPIQIVKNLRICGDCHTVIELISLIEERALIVRDSNRFHHFKGGVCSCGGYWYHHNELVLQRFSILILKIWMKMIRKVWI
ncbi:pentatricopeptide repeat-containing protein At2g27610 isoform X2 [Benincasa hispida]|uniref:pentatricopeptide repeat-containing protein At2g27610 isoform X2 n=1 Tax=Benincasa hispida TaxID=102211 RepID=UPI001900E8B7|nr:pentatricopeptide repeat-containing protein At2g27610 isoform X2 [Benincasa hispida]